MGTDFEVQVRRVYEQPAAGDGTRVLVDRVWPRGLAKDQVRLDAWLRAAAPSTELRRWYGHAAERFEEFRRRYHAELDEPERAEAVRHLCRLTRSGPLTLLTATRDVEHSHALVLAHWLAAARADSGAEAGLETDEGGDPPCWLARVCPDCGAIADTDPPTVCPRCRSKIPGMAPV
jgi:uncharacterized protein YeaO (DUF488 family)